MLRIGVHRIWVRHLSLGLNLDLHLHLIEADYSNIL
jgi:hypothetical protein